jgi:hypothetical protein
VYFVPGGYEPELRAIERFVGELKDRLGEAKRMLVMAWSWWTGRSTATPSPPPWTSRWTGRPTP